MVAGNQCVVSLSKTIYPRIGSTQEASRHNGKNVDWDMYIKRQLKLTNKLPPRNASPFVALDQVPMVIKHCFMLNSIEHEIIMLFQLKCNNC